MKRERKILELNKETLRKIKGSVWQVRSQGCVGIDVNDSLEGYACGPTEDPADCPKFVLR